MFGSHSLSTMYSVTRNFGADGVPTSISSAPRICASEPAATVEWSLRCMVSWFASAMAYSTA